MSKFLMFIDDDNDVACYPTEKLISMTCAADGVLLLHFKSSLGWSDDGDIVTLTIFKGPATATITITDFTELNTGDKVNLIATDTTNYDFTNGDQSSVAGTWESTTSNDQTATNLMNVINTSSGPSGTRFTATVLGAVITVTQATTGVHGNSVITLTDAGTAGMTKVDFTGGHDGVINISERMSGGHDGIYFNSNITGCTITLSGAE